MQSVWFVGFISHYIKETYAFNVFIKGYKLPFLNIYIDAKIYNCKVLIYIYK